MADPPPLDLLIKRVRVVRPHRPAVDLLDLGIRDGRFARIAPEIPAAEAQQVFDADHLLGFPGVVDAHTHAGIYAPLADDAVTESRAPAMGGVTTMLTYFRSGQYYLNRGGPYAEIFPEVLRLSRDRYWVDYGYDLAPFEFIMRAAARVQQAHPHLAEHVSVSLHCEVADILNAYTRLVQRDPSLTGLKAYSAARPPHAEGLAVWIASYLAH